MARAMRELFCVRPRFRKINFEYATERNVMLERGYYRLKMAAGGGGGAYNLSKTSVGSSSTGKFSVASGGSGASIDCIIRAESRGEASIVIGGGGAGGHTSGGSTGGKGGDTSFTFGSTRIVLGGGSGGHSNTSSKGTGGAAGDATTIEGIVRKINETCKGGGGEAAYKTKMDDLWDQTYASGGHPAVEGTISYLGTGGGATIRIVVEGGDYEVQGSMDDGGDGFMSIEYLGKKEPVI